MDTLGSPYESENPTASEVFGADEIRNDDMMYSANISIATLRYAKGSKAEYDLQLF